GRPLDPHLHQDRRRRHHGPRRSEPHRQDGGAARRVRRRGRGQQLSRGRSRARRPGRRRRRGPARRAERPVRPRRRPVHARGAGPGLPAAAGHPRLHGPARAGVRRVQRPVGEAGQLHPARGHPGRGAAARLPHRGAPRGTLHVGAARGRAGPHVARARALPESPVGPAVHPVARGEPGRRRAVDAGRRTSGHRL
ncbi:MAG: ATP:Cob(I)alamin adenosyltransferase, partial [uncultured Frankineae bacterium]